MAIRAADLLVNVRADVDRAQRNLRKVDDQLQRMGGRTFPIAAKAAKAFGVAALAGFAVLGTQAVTGSVLAFTGAVVAMVGVLAAAPAALTALIGTFAAVKVGLMGMGDAMKSLGGTAEEFAEGIKDLAPNAQGFMKALRGMREEASELRKHVQNHLFAGFRKEVTLLGRAYLPMLKDSLAQVADGVNQGTREFSQMLRQGNRVEDIRRLLGGTSGAARGLMRGVRNIVEAFIDLARGGQRSLDGIGSAIERVTGRFRDWAKEARETGKVQEWIDQGMRAVKAFGQVLANIGGILRGIFRAMETGTGGPFAGLVQITGKIKELVNSVAGQDALRSFFQSAAKAVDALAPVLGAVLTAIGQIAPVFANIATGIGPGLTDFIKALGKEFGGLASEGSTLGESLGEFLRSLIPVIPMVADLIRMIVGAVKAIAPFGPALVGLAGAMAAMKVVLTVNAALGTFTSGLGLVGRGLVGAGRGAANFAAGLTQAGAGSSAFTGKMGTIGGALRTVWLGFWKGVWAALGWAEKVILAAGRAAGRFAVATGRMIAASAKWAAALIADAVKATAKMAWAAGKIAAKWAWLAVQAMISAVRMAAAWFIALGPIGWAIAAVIALVALVIWKWDEIKAWTIKAWKAVAAYVDSVWERMKTGVRDGVNMIKGWITGSWNYVVTRTKQAWQTLKDAVVGKVREVIADVKALPGRIMSALGNLGSLLYDSGRRILDGLVRGIRSMGSAVKDAVTGVLRDARNLLPFSPAKEGPFSGKGWSLYSGRSISEALAKGLSDRTAAVKRAAMEAARAAAGPLEGLGAGIGRAGAPRAAQARPRTPADLARPGSAGNSLALTFISHNPIAEPQSVTTNKALSRAGALGLV